jgi:hypothetical protein
MTTERDKVAPPRDHQHPHAAKIRTVPPTGGRFSVEHVACPAPCGALHFAGVA